MCDVGMWKDPLVIVWDVVASYTQRKERIIWMWSLLAVSCRSLE
jgi:hypothetical protein